MIRVYGATKSRAFRCIWMLEEVGIPYEQVPIGWDTGETRTPEYLAVNPNGRIPALVDGDLVVWESLAINLYLARRYGAELGAQSPEEEGEILRWSFWAMGELEGPIDAVADRGAKLADDWAAKALGVLDAALEGTGALVAGRFTVADLNVACMFWRPLLARFDRSSYANVSRFVDACAERPAFQKMAARF